MRKNARIINFHGKSLTAKQWVGLLHPPEDQERENLAIRNRIARMRKLGQYFNAEYALFGACGAPRDFNARNNNELAQILQTALQQVLPGLIPHIIPALSDALTPKLLQLTAGIAIKGIDNVSQCDSCPHLPKGIDNVSQGDSCPHLHKDNDNDSIPPKDNDSIPPKDNDSIPVLTIDLKDNDLNNDPNDNASIPVLNNDPNDNASIPVLNNDPKDNASIPVLTNDPKDNASIPVLDTPQPLEIVITPDTHLKWMDKTDPLFLPTIRALMAYHNIEDKISYKGLMSERTLNFNLDTLEDYINASMVDHSSLIEEEQMRKQGR